MAKNTTICRLCPGGEVPITSKYRRHLQIKHLPWYFDPQLACWEHQRNFGQSGVLLKHRAMEGCKGTFGEPELGVWVKSMAGFLRFLGNKLCGGELKDLVSMVQKKGLFPRKTNSVDVPVVTQVLWRELDTHVGWCPPVIYRVDPPETPAGLLHVNILQELLPLLKGEVLKEVQQLEINGATSTETPRRKVKVADSHCHLIPTLRKHRVENMHGLRVRSKEFLDGYTKVTLVICNIAHPDCWASWKELERDRGVFFVFGIHPLVAAERGLYIADREFREVLQGRYCRGVGECGLDTSRCHTKEEVTDVLQRQIPVFQAQLQYSREFDLAVVIHVRGRNGKELIALNCQAIEIMKSILRKKHKIHVHCYVGDLETYFKWIHAFPQAKFGFTSKVEGNEGVIRSMDPRRMLLESDAPYLTPRAIAAEWGRKVGNSPYFVEANLDFLGNQLNLPGRVLGQVVYANCLELYGVEDVY